MRTKQLIFLFCLSAAIGCSSHKTVRTETVSRDPGYASEETRTETVTETEAKNDSCSGVLSCGVNVAGEVIAFPFKAVGAVVSAIF